MASKIVSLYVPEEEYGPLKAMADQTGTSVSNTILGLVRKGMGPVMDTPDTTTPDHMDVIFETNPRAYRIGLLTALGYNPNLYDVDGEFHYHKMDQLRDPSFMRLYLKPEPAKVHPYREPKSRDTIKLWDPLV